MVKLETTRILKKLDGYSVLLAFVLSYAFQSFYTFAYDLSGRLTSWVGGSTEYMGFGTGRNWQDTYLNPIFNAIIWLLLVEVSLQIIKMFKTRK